MISSNLQSILSISISVASVVVALCVFHHQIIKSRQQMLVIEIVKRMEDMNALAIRSFAGRLYGDYAKFISNKNIVLNNIVKFFDCHTWSKGANGIKKQWYKYYKKRECVTKKDELIKAFNDWVEYIELHTPIENSGVRLKTIVIQTIYLKSSNIFNTLYNTY